MLKKAYKTYLDLGEAIVNNYYRTKVKISNSVYQLDTISKNNIKTLLIVCGPGFVQGFPIANSLMREGFAGGWAEKYGYAKLVSVFDLEREIEHHDNPAIFLSCYDFTYLNYSVLKKLRNYNTFVWVSVHPRMFNKFENLVLLEKGQTDFEIWRNAYAKILYSEPKFVWNSTCNETFEWYQGWVDDGLKWQTIHPAIDERIYYPDHSEEKYKNIKMAYVGGYWTDKAQAFDSYFRQHEAQLHTFGYSKWPYKNYGGKLTINEERQLYTACGLVPLVTSPSGWAIGEITERYFKAPACNAFCICDENPAIKEIFGNDEFLIASDSQEFHYLVNEYLNNRIDTILWRSKGYDAVINNHLYRNRAEQISNAL
jgi:hypothetical protein